MLTGHKSSITSLAFHPFQGFLASGSTDTNIKVSHFNLLIIRKKTFFCCLNNPRNGGPRKYIKM